MTGEEDYKHDVTNKEINTGGRTREYVQTETRFGCQRFVGHSILVVSTSSAHCGRNH